VSDAKARWWETCRDDPMDMIGCYEEFPRYRRKWQLVVHACSVAIPVLARHERFAPVLDELLTAVDEGQPTGSSAIHLPTRAAAIGWHPREHGDEEFLVALVIGAAYETRDPYWVTDVLLRALWDHVGEGEIGRHCAIVREVFSNPFRPVTFSPAWRTDTAVSLARTMYESREFGAMPILADVLQDAGCDSDDILNHCRDASLTHVRGCWVIDLVLGKG
jgi:hypothetical protein